VTEWKDIPGYEGFYQVSDQGQVKSVERIGVNGTFVPERILRPDTANPGRYERVTLFGGPSRQRCQVHRLVMLAFIGPCPEGLECCHNDGHPGNNALSNLRYDTKSANARDRRRHGSDYELNRTHCPEGHPYDGENTFIKDGSRNCRECGRIRQRVYLRENRETIRARKRGRYWNDPEKARAQRRACYGRQRQAA